jgi:hypothetical protein
MEVNKTTQAEAVRNFYRRQGAEQERNRIIDLLYDQLKAFQIEYPDFATAVVKESQAWNILEEIIEIIEKDIKGETK